MAQGSENTSNVLGNSFQTGMIYDSTDIPDGSYVHARNATHCTVLGDLGDRSNEPSNLHCADIPYTVIGTIHLYGDVWAVFSTDDINSEIGIFDDSECKYTMTVHDPCVPSQIPLCTCNDTTSCLGFKKSNLIKGIAKQNFDCSWQVYWADNNQPDRTMNMDKPAFIQNCTIVDSCQICTDTCQIDCEAIRLARLMVSPCLTVTRGNNGGNLQNGSYFAVIAYVINEQRVTDYFPLSNVQSIFEHENLSGSLNIAINEIDTEHFDEFELVIVRTINQQTSAKRIGIYSTRTKYIFIDQIAESLITIPIELIPFRSPVYEKSEAIYNVGTYALRVAPTTKFDFNYQPLANRITSKWISVEYPSDYYRKGGNITSYMRDEVYPFFIRWVYGTGDRSSSYHIPGRDAIASDRNPAPIGDTLSIDSDAQNPPPPENWEVYNTATTTYIGPSIPQDDGGVLIAKGDMAFWESSEIYPDNQPDIWNASSQPWSQIIGELPVDLCGKPIRHHKMPDNLTHPTLTNHFFKYPNNVIKIRVIGVEFDKIRAPRDNQGNLIPGIVGYEILRGSREGNKTVVAKGIINNTRNYTLSTPEVTASKQGLYPNYPYNPLGNDTTIALTDQSDHGGYGILLPVATQSAAQVNKSVFTFHSPDTQFKNPFLSMKEIKLYEEINGKVVGNFEDVPGHPKEKLLGDLSFFLAAILGLATAGLAIVGRKTTTFTPSSNNATGFVGPAGTDIPLGILANTTSNTLATALEVIETVPGTSTGSLINVLSAAILGNELSVNEVARNIPIGVARVATSANAAAVPPLIDNAREWSDFDYTGPLLKAVSGLITFGYYWTLGTDSALRLIESIVQYRQYAYRYRSHGLYDTFSAGNVAPGNFRRELSNISYLDNQFQDFGINYRVNNLYRGKAVILETTQIINNPVGIDNTVQSISTAATLGTGNVTLTTPKEEFGTETTVYYAALKVKLRNQYGQMTSIQEIPITCVFSSLDPNEQQILTDQTTGPIFGGDTYVTRYTEKNTFFYFYDWLLGQPDGTEFNYRLRYMINFPNYWADFTKFEAGEFLQAFLGFINPLSPDFFDVTAVFNGLPSGKARLDRIGSNFALSNIFGALTFGIKNAYFYLFQSGVRDFFVESEINTDLRDWGNVPEERYYDPYRYTDTFSLFDPKIIKSGNFFKYDSSLSISRLFINFISWGNQQPRSYNPIVAEECFSFYPFRVIYSLPQNLENKKDYWRIFLANNYKDFKSRITAIKSINKNGAIILFETTSPIQFQGVDSLVTGLGTKITLGDGGLFSQPLQYTTNADESYEYGSCQNRLSVINTPAGLYWMSENQGKVFRMTDTMSDITVTGLKFWFKKYLPYFLTQDFPNYDLIDNPVVGIGCQAIYDNQIDIVYFCKRDFKLKPQFKFDPLTGQGLEYVPAVTDPITHLIIPGYFNLNGVTSNIVVGDPIFFEDSSWTVSYDQKGNQGRGAWISYHDWHPSLLMPSKNNFLSIKDNGIWRHNLRTDSFCNFYGTDYPFELTYTANTDISVNTIRSIEYYLECYKYDISGINKYQLLDFNFDEAIVDNSEQVSGVLNLVLSPKNNPIAALKYPKLNSSSIDILYTKEEQKYRFDNFFDVTDDRGEFTNVQRVIWLTDSSGYKHELNSLNLNYQKAQTQRKKFRHFLNYISLTRKVSGNINMIMSTALSKLLKSKR